MTAPAAAALINLLGYITVSVLYAMLLGMALGRQDGASSIGMGGARSEKADRLPLLTALLGLALNLGLITVFVMQSLAWPGGTSDEQQIASCDRWPMSK